MSADELMARIEQAKRKNEAIAASLRERHGELTEQARRFLRNIYHGDVTEALWSEALQRRARAGEFDWYDERRRAWTDPKTGRAVEPRRYPDGRVSRGGDVYAFEHKASPYAALSSSTRNQIDLDTTAIRNGYELGGDEIKGVIRTYGFPVFDPDGKLLPGFTTTDAENWARWARDNQISDQASNIVENTDQASNVVENTHDSGGVLRGANKFLGPAGDLMDAYSLYEAYESDGGRMGENFKETAGGVAGGMAGGWAGMQAGAAIGSLGGPVGTVVGGIIGGIAGGIGGEKVGEFLGGLF